MMNAFRLALAIGLVLGLAGCDETEQIFGHATRKGATDVAPQPPVDKATQDALHQRIRLQSYN
jgi:hypothetical protein